MSSFSSASEKAAPSGPEEFTISSKELENPFGYMPKKNVGVARAANPPPPRQVGGAGQVGRQDDMRKYEK